MTISVHEVEWAIQVLFEICKGVCFKKMFMMLSMALSPFKTQMMSLRSIITSLSSIPNKISSSWAFPPHRLSVTSFHFLNILHTKWASNESCLPKNIMNLKSLKDFKTHFISLGTNNVTIGNAVSSSSFTWGTKSSPQGLNSLEISLVKFTKEI